MKRVVLLVLTFAWMGLQSCTPVFAQSDSSPKAMLEKKPNEPSKNGDSEKYGADRSPDIGPKLGLGPSRRQDRKYTLTGNYALFEMWTLSKYGLTLGYNKNESTTYEFEYMRGSLGFGYFGINLGAVEEERFGLNWRTFGKRNSFNFVTGLYYNILGLHVGNRALESVSNGRRTSVDLLEIHTIGINWGIGNRWQTKSGFVWGVDWMAIHVPVWIVRQEHPFIDATNNESFRKDAQNALRFFRRIPEIAALKFQLGFGF